MGDNVSQHICSEFQSIEATHNFAQTGTLQVMFRQFRQGSYSFAAVSISNDVQPRVAMSLQLKNAKLCFKKDQILNFAR